MLLTRAGRVKPKKKLAGSNHKLVLGVSRKGRGLTKRAVPAAKPAVKGGWVHDKFLENNHSGLELVGVRRKEKIVVRLAGAKRGGTGRNKFMVSLRGAKGASRTARVTAKRNGIVAAGAARIWGLANTEVARAAHTVRPAPNGDVEGMWQHDMFHATGQNQSASTRTGRGRARSGRGKGGRSRSGRGRGGRQRGGAGSEATDMDLGTRIDSALPA